MIDQESIEYSQGETDRENPKNEASEKRKTAQRLKKTGEPKEEEGKRAFRSDGGLARLRRQREVIEARIQLAQARLKAQQRKQETHRKILVGSYYLNKAAKENGWESLKSIMDGYLTRESDRKLFE